MPYGFFLLISVALIWEILVRSLKQKKYPRIAIVAPPGAGKTTMLEHLALVYSQNIQRRYHPKAPKLIPILIKLRDKDIQERITGYEPPNLAKLIQEQKWIQELNPQHDWFKKRLDKGKCLIMIDGLDEVANLSQRKKVSLWVNQQMQSCPCVFIVTSRPYGYRSASIDRVRLVLEVKPFNLTQVKEFIRNWYLQTEIYRNWYRQSENHQRNSKVSRTIRREAIRQADDLIDRIKRNPPLAAMAVNPLLLRMISVVHYYRGVLPGRRVELYAEICDVLLGRRQDAKGIATNFTARQKQRVLQTLALGLMQGKTARGKSLAFTLEEGGALIENKLKAVIEQNVEPSQFLRDISDLTGLLTEREKGIYQFAHKSFQEYLAAIEIKDYPENISLLTDSLDDPWWEETIRLYAAERDANSLVERALIQSTVKSLALAYDCIVTEEAEVRPGLKRQIEDRLDAGLEAEDLETFKLAASVQLIQRLKKIIRIDDKLGVDYSYVSNAEYQLFLELNYNSSIAMSEQNFLEDNLSTESEFKIDSGVPRFKPGTAKNPVTGISSEDAKAFCEYLSIHYLPNDLSEETASYRPISDKEKQEYKILEDQTLAQSGGIRLVRQHSQNSISVLSCRITPPRDLFQYRAIGLLKGKYIPSEETFTKGKLLVSNGMFIDAILLGRTLRTVRNLDLKKEQIWVVFPRTRKGLPHLHVQIKGVKAPRWKNHSPNDYPSSEVVNVNMGRVDYFSIRGKVVDRNLQKGYVMVQILMAPQDLKKEAKAFKLRLEGSLPPSAEGTFWNFDVEREADRLVIRELFRP
jgi:hypothetical protein